MTNEKGSEKLAVVREVLKSLRVYIELHEWPACVMISTSVLWTCCAVVGWKYIDKKYTYVYPELSYEGIYREG